MKNRFEILINDINDLVEKGKIRVVGQRLNGLRFASLPRKSRHRLARLARRAGLFPVSIRILNPIVRPPPKSPREATDEEKAEYAASLVKIGASSEALDILMRLDAKLTPEKLLYEAYALITQWNYLDSIPLLVDYINSEGIEEHQKIIGRINLAAAYVHERIRPQAIEALKALRVETKKLSYRQLYGSVLELSAQDAIFHRQWREARIYLDQAGQIFRQTGTLYEFYVSKWRAILEACRTKKSFNPLKAIRERACQLKNWETVRDCDFYLALCGRDEDLFFHVYFGTLFESYQKRILQDYSHPVKLPDSYMWKDSLKPPTHILNLTTGDLDNSKLFLKPGQLLFRLANILCSDFYRPFRVAFLHSLLYPEEYFNPQTSPAKIHEAVKRFKKWLGKHKLPYEIVETSGAYQLRVGKGGAIRVSGKAMDSQTILLSKLKSKWPGRAFSTKEACLVLKVSSRTASRIIKRAQKEGKLNKTGDSSSTRYRFAT